MHFRLFVSLSRSSRLFVQTVWACGFSCAFHKPPSVLLLFIRLAHTFMVNCVQSTIYFYSKHILPFQFVSSIVDHFGLLLFTSARHYCDESHFTFKCPINFCWFGHSHPMLFSFTTHTNPIQTHHRHCNSPSKYRHTLQILSSNLYFFTVRIYLSNNYEKDFVSFLLAHCFVLFSLSLSLTPQSNRTLQLIHNAFF
jgi:hypothetical protein